MNNEIHGERITWKRRALAALYLGVRIYAAFTLLSYGFAKLMGAQFTVLDSQLAKPIGEVSGFWLTWYYFGFSPVYAGVIAGTQIIGALLLCFRRSALLGALLLLPVIINIVIVDRWVIRWGLDVDALRRAIYVLTALLVVVAFHGKDLHTFFLRRRSQFALLDRSPGWSVAAQILVVFGMLGYTAHQAYWLANVNNRAPTPIDGAWHLVQSQPTGTDLPEWIYFEYNRAHMAVFRFPSGKSEIHDFRVDPRSKTIDIAKVWLTPGSDILSGTWVRTGDTLIINGTWTSTPFTTVTLQRKEMPVKDHR